MTDGTVAGTGKLLDSLRNYTPFYRPITVVNNSVCVFVSEPSGYYNMWLSDGTVSGTQMIQHVAFGQGNSFFPEMTQYKGLYYFFSNDNPVSTGHIWRTDGTVAGTSIFRTTSFLHKAASAYGFTEMDGKLYYVANDTSWITALYVTDGTDTGTHIVKILEAYPSTGGPNGMIMFNHHLYFGVYNIALQNDIMWMSDGTAAGTQKIYEDIEGDTATLKYRTLPFAFDGDVYFGATAIHNNQFTPSYWRIRGPQPYRIVASIPETDEDNLTIYPNPAVNEIRIQGDDIFDYTLFDVRGKQVRSGHSITSNTTISVAGLAQGMYYLKVVQQRKTRGYSISVMGN